MKNSLFLTALLITFPNISSAQGLQDFLINIPIFLNETVLPFLMGIAFLFFVINVIRYFVIGGANREVQENAKSVALYSILAFVFLVIFWGVVVLLVDSIGLDDGEEVSCPDYLEQSGGCF